MKVHVDVECTPSEARTLVGLPDVKPMQDALLKEVEARMKRALSAMDPDSLFKMWLPASVQGWEQWQKFVWSRLTGAAREVTKTAESDEESKTS